MTKPLPRAVQAKLDAAEAQLQQMNNPAPSPAPEPEVPTPAPAVPEPQAEPAPSPAPAPHADFDRLLQQHRSLQGVHRSLEDRARQSASEAQQLRDEVERLKREREQAPAAPTVDHKDTEVFGDDLVNMVVRQAKSQMAPEMQAIRTQIQEILGYLQGTNKAVAQTAEEVFVSRLKDAVPDYAEINVDPGFLQWLGEEDPVYGLPRQAALDNASKRLDVERTAKVFLAYKALTAKPAAPAAPQKSAAASELERQVSPSNASAAPPAPRATRTYILEKEIEDFYREVQQGKYRGKEELRGQIEQTINNALAAGRVFKHAPHQPV